jgi:enoyl-CoA hydratase/carnithine racemase
MAYEALEVKQDGAIAWITLNRPHVLNALNSTMVSELHDYLDRLGSDRATRVIIVRGAGRAFCAGLDLKEHSGGRPGDETLGSSTSATLEIQRHISGLVIAIRRLPQPFIAAVRGPASGGGFALAMACDVRLAGVSARFNAAFIRIGLTGCDMGISYTLPRAVGTSIAYELLLTGRVIDAQRALATRLVSEVVADEELDATAGKLAREMVEASPLGLSLTKECISANIDAASIENAIAMEDRNQALCVRSGYLAEGARAFVEKRKPHFAARA